MPNKFKYLLVTVVSIFCTLSNAYDNSEVVDAQLFQIGYFVSSSVLDDSFFFYKPSVDSFSPLKKAHVTHLESSDWNRLSKLENSIVQYIEKEQTEKLKKCRKQEPNCTDSFYSQNGFTATYLARRIIESSYCFGTDPFIVASKIRQESEFNLWAKSPTGALGLTQITNDGIKEVLDQLGHRGSGFALPESNTYIRSVMSCFFADKISEELEDFPAISVADVGHRSSNKKNFFLQKKTYSSVSLANIRNWFYPKSKSTRGTEAERLVDRQLFLGQTLLKIYLSYSKMAHSSAAIAQHYKSALRMFNGDTIRYQYATQVMKKSVISF